MKRIFPLFFLLCFFARVHGQQARLIRGLVLDTAGISIIGAVVKVSTATDSLKTSTNANGVFTFNAVKWPEVNISVSYVGYKNYARSYTLPPGTAVFVPDTIVLHESASAMKEVTITGIIPVVVKEDTVQYNAAAYPVRPGDAVEEVIKKLPGVQVDREGNVSVNGKPITQIRLNGKDFFGSDVATAIQNLPADVVKNLQVIDDYGDQAKVTGAKMGEPRKILNINVTEKKGAFVRGTGGMGNESRFITNVKGNTYVNERMISYDGSVNNTNVRGGGGDGITNTKSAKLNYRNEFSKKISVNAGYDFSARNNNTLSTQYRQSAYKAYTRFDDQATNNTSGNLSHSFYGNFEYRPDTVHYFKLSPNLSYSSSESTNDGRTNTTIPKRNTRSVRDNVSSNHSSTPNLALNFFVSRRLKKKDRNVNLSIDIGNSDNESDRSSENRYTNTDSLGKQTFQNQYQLSGNTNRNTRYGVNLGYHEPLGKDRFLDFNYNWNSTDTRSGKDTRDVDPKTGAEVFNTSLSNQYKYRFVTNRIGVNFREMKARYNYTIGLNVQPALLTGQDLTRNNQTRKTTFNWIPSARFVFHVDKGQALTLNYNGRSNQPNFNQLQPITDNSNLQNTISGNPDLKPDFTHSISLDYNQTDWKKGYNMFSNFAYNLTQDRIVTRKVLLDDGIRQSTTYMNTDGFYNMNGNYSLVKAFVERRYEVTYSGGLNFTKNIAFSNFDRNVARNLVISQGLKFRVNIVDRIDAEVNGGYANNKTDYSLPTSRDNRTQRYTLGVGGRSYFHKDLSLGYDLSRVMNKGLTGSSANANPTILNVYMEYRMMRKRGNLRIQGFDLLNQNTGISRDVYGDEIVDRQTNRLARYFLMSFSMSIRKFSGKK